MLKAYACGHARLIETEPTDATRPVWLDLLNPTPEEEASIERDTGLTLPSQSDIMEIENSSRLSAEGEVLTLTMPLVTRSPDGLHASSCAFVLAPDRLITIRYATSQVFEAFPSQPHEVGELEAANAAFIFVGLLEAIVDRQADALEQLRTELDTLSHKIFRPKPSIRQPGGQRQPKEEATLQRRLISLGNSYDIISMLRESQHGIDRIAPYVATTATWFPEPALKRLKTLHTDVHSLNEFSVHLTDKVQFLLDATLGLISISQNTLMKVFTIVSVVGIPPTLMAGVYGMNFHIMPELSWHYGYAYGLSVILLSALLPLWWFRHKNWI